MTHERTRDTAPLPDEPYYQQPPAYNQPMQPPARPNSARRAGIALIVVGLLWLAFTLPGRGFTLFGGGGSTTLLNETYTAQNLVMNVGSADVEVQRWNDNGIHVEATQRGGARGDYTVQANVSGDTLQLAQEQHRSWSWFSDRGLHYVVSIPADAHVQVETVSGDVQVTDALRGVEITTTNGDVQLEDVAGSLNVTTVSGDVNLKDGQVQNATVQTTNGDIDLHGVAGAVTLSSTNGDISVDEATPTALNINVTNSSIEYHGSLAPGSQNKIEAVNGDIQLHLPRESGFALHADTISGDLNLDDSFEAQRKAGNGTALDATVGDGSATLDVQTINGDIEIEAQ